MSNGSGDLPPLIALAFPRHAVKHIELHLGCTPRQAQRIVETGRAPGRFKSALKTILLRAMEANQRALQHHIMELRGSDYAAMVSRAADRRASGDGASAAAAVGSAGGAAASLEASND